MRHLEVSETLLLVKVDWKTEAENEGSLHAFGIHRSCENPFDVWGRCSSSLMTFHRGTWVININMKMNDSAKWFSWLFNHLQYNVCAGGLHWPVTFHLNGTVIVMLYNMCRSLATTHLHKQTKSRSISQSEPTCCLYCLLFAFLFYFKVGVYLLRILKQPQSSRPPKKKKIYSM